MGVIPFKKFKKMIKVKFLVDYPPFQKKDDILEINKNVANLLIKRGVCVQFDEKNIEPFSELVEEEKPARKNLKKN